MKTRGWKLSVRQVLGEKKKERFKSALMRRWLKNQAGILEEGREKREKKYTYRGYES